MKKTYSKPELVCINIQVQQLICESIRDVSNVDGFGYGGDTGENSITEGGSRRGTFWDED